MERDICRLELANALLTALAAEGVNLSDEKLDASALFQLIEQPPERALGDFAFPCFRFAKTLRKSPNVIAGNVAKFFAEKKPTTWIQEAKNVNAFVNFFVNKGKFAAYSVEQVLQGKTAKAFAPKSKPSKVMIEYSQPNTHKEFHVGHVRNVALGASLVRLFRFCGYDTIAANYFGDEGAHIAKCLWHIQKNKLQAPPTHRGEWLGEQYSSASKTYNEASETDKKTYDAEISQILRNIEQRSGADYELWKTTRQWSLDEFKRIYKWLDAPFDRDFTESELSEDSQKIVDRYLAKGIFQESQGAIGRNMEDIGLGFLLLRKRDGNTLYATKDLVLAERKFSEYKIDRSIYVVGNEQEHHFRQVFKMLEIMGFPQAKNCFHLSYGMVVLPDGKMSSRAGKTISFNQFSETMTTALKEFLKKYEGEWSPAEIDDTAHKLCVGAILYGMLQADAHSSLVFDWNQWISFEGNTGPYLMYSYARTRSIMRKGEEAGIKLDTKGKDSTFAQLLVEDAEQELLRYLYDFLGVVIDSCEQYRPSHLCHHLFDMCKSFNRFYSDCPILAAESADVKKARLMLTQAFSDVLRLGLNLLGIQPPEKM